MNRVMGSMHQGKEMGGEREGGRESSVIRGTEKMFNPVDMPPPLDFGEPCTSIFT